VQEKFADTIGEIGSRKSKKDRQHNGQKTKGQTMIYKRLHRKQTIAKDEPHRQERLNSSIGPWEKQCNGTPTYTTSLVNKTINVDQIKHNLLYWYFQQNQCLCIKNMPCTTYIDHHGSYARWHPENCTACPCAKKTLSIGKGSGVNLGDVGG
jgi:hypothetical protein